MLILKVLDNTITNQTRCDLTLHRVFYCAICLPSKPLAVYRVEL